MKEYTVKVKYVDYDYCTVTALNKTEAMMKAKDMYEGFIQLEALYAEEVSDED